MDSHPKADTLPHNWQSVGKNFYRQREGAMCRNSTVSSDSHLETDHQWSDQSHLDCFKYNQSSIPDLICSRFREASSRNCGSFFYGYSLVITQLTSFIWWGFQYLQESSQNMAQNIIYSPWGSPWLYLKAKLLLFGLLWLFSFVSAFSHFSDQTYSLVKVSP